MRADGDGVMTDEERLAEIEARAAKATAGPWAVDGSSAADIALGVTYGDDTETWVQSSTGHIDDEGGHTVDDAQFIAHARTDVPWLVERVRALTAEHDQTLKAFAGYRVQRRADDEWLAESVKIKTVLGILRRERKRRDS